jgi:hypothetical protein
MGTMADCIQGRLCDIIRIANIESIAHIDARHGCISILVTVTAA